ncbi:uncharacterized protein LOC141911843 [Tubulanus polymorphus]|uniref:uncharacterized protein LOC141911843 n=1 Tax=Tubulanus polymorphus TaxID=672921 RepID=UPI003DA527F6
MTFKMLQNKSCILSVCVLVLVILILQVQQSSAAGKCGCTMDQFTASATVNYTLGENGKYGVYQNWVRYSIDNKNKRMREDIRTISGRKLSTVVVDLKKKVGWVTIPGVFDCAVFVPLGEMDDRCLFRKGEEFALHDFDVEKYEVKLPHFPGKLIATFDKKSCYPTEFKITSAYTYSGTKVEMLAKFDFISPYVYDGAFDSLCEGEPTMVMQTPSINGKSAADIAQVISYFSRR